MAKKKLSKPTIKAVANAKAEIVAKATYQRKHSTTEIVPPDVSRAKAGAWLDFLSPITEWAGMKGDRLRAKRNLFRIQQEETLFRVGEKVRRKIENKPIEPVPPKILVPALEASSLESPSDEVMIDVWASLLASAASGVAVEPKYVAILRELSGRQATFLRRLATYQAGAYDVPYEHFIEDYDREFNVFTDAFLEKFPAKSKIPDLHP